MLFGEVELPARFEAAARAGFKAVEIQFPYAREITRRAIAGSRACPRAPRSSGAASRARSNTRRRSAAGG